MPFLSGDTKTSGMPFQISPFEGESRPKGGRGSNTRCSEVLHPLKHAIVLSIHSEPRIHLLRRSIPPIHVQPNPPHALVLPRQALDIPVHSRIHPLPPRARHDIHTLNPPDDPIPPVTPFVRDQR